MLVHLLPQVQVVQVLLVAQVLFLSVAPLPQVLPRALHLLHRFPVPLLLALAVQVHHRVLVHLPVLHYHPARHQAVLYRLAQVALLLVQALRALVFHLVQARVLVLPLPQAVVLPHLLVLQARPVHCLLQVQAHLALAVLRVLLRLLFLAHPVVLVHFQVLVHRPVPHQARVPAVRVFHHQVPLVLRVHRYPQAPAVLLLLPVALLVALLAV